MSEHKYVDLRKPRDYDPDVGGYDRWEDLQNDQIWEAAVALADQVENEFGDETEALWYETYIEGLVEVGQEWFPQRDSLPIKWFVRQAMIQIHEERNA